MTRYCTDCHKPFQANGEWQRRCWTCWRSDQYQQALADAYQRGLAAAKPIDPQLLRKAITLCHPDRHPPERAELATRVTAELMALRDQQPRQHGMVA